MTTLSSPSETTPDPAPEPAPDPLPGPAPDITGPPRFLIPVTAVLAFMVLYAPQPLLPLLAGRFGVGKSVAGLLVTLTLAPLAVAPLCYGYVLQKVPARKVLATALLGLALSECAFGLAGSMGMLLAIRFFQGLLLPAAFTSMMTLTAQTHTLDQLQMAMSVYVAATIMGGYLGRLLSGLSATFFDWRAFFLVLAVALAGLLALWTRQANPRALKPPSPSDRSTVSALKTGGALMLFCIAGCAFFVFASLMNYLPFRVKSISPAASEFLIGATYTGYLCGIGTSIFSSRLIRLLKSSANAMQVAFAAYAAALLITLVPSVSVLFASLFLFCGAMFTIHSTAMGMVNRTAGERKGIVNGLYLAFYYAGGVAGSYLPGIVYENRGWPWFIAVLVCVAGIGFYTARKYGKLHEQPLRDSAEGPAAVPPPGNGQNTA